MVGSPSEDWRERDARSVRGRQERAKKIKIERLREAFDRVAPTYDEVADGNEVARAEDAWLRRRFLASYMSRPPQRRQVIDLACGTGWLLDNVSIPPEDYVGVDLSPGMIARARQKHPQHRFEVMDMHRLWLPKADVVFMGFDTINLSPAAHEVVEVINRCLVPRGIVFVVFVSPAHASQPCACHDYTPDDLRNWYTPDQAVRMFEAKFTHLAVEAMPAPPEHADAYFVLEGRRRSYLTANDEVSRF